MSEYNDPFRDVYRLGGSPFRTSYIETTKSDWEEETTEVARTAEDIIYLLGEFASDLPAMRTPDISDNYKSNVTAAIQEAISLLRTHALAID